MASLRMLISPHGHQLRLTKSNRALFTATQRLDRERFLGARATDTQSLQWPRTGVRKPDTYINTYAVGFPFRISTDYFD
jgi:hypothetical protein